MHSFHNILFLDIETVPQYASFDVLPEDAKPYWTKKAEQMKRDKELDTPESLYPKAGIYAEFGKIVCISCGYFVNENDEATNLLLLEIRNDSNKD